MGNRKLFTYTDKDGLSNKLAQSAAGGRINVRSVGREKIRLLQLSDLHFHYEISKKSDQERVKTRYVELFDEIIDFWTSQSKYTTLDQERAAAPCAFDGIIISGDFVHARRLKLPTPEPHNNSSSEPGKVEDAAEKLSDAHKFAVSGLDSFIQRLDEEGSPPISVLVVPGNHDIFLSGDDLGPKSGRLAMNYSYCHNVHRMYDSDVDDTPEVFASSPRVTIHEGSGGVVAVFGLDSNHAVYTDRMQYKHGQVTRRQLKQLEAAIEHLGTIYATKPVYAIVVLHHHILPVRDIEIERKNNTSGDTGARKVMESVLLDGPTVVSYLQEMRVSLVLHGHMHKQFFAQTAGYFSGGVRHPVAILGCPSFPQPGYTPEPTDIGTPGGMVLNFDTERGSAQVDVIHKRKREDRVKDEWECSSVSIPLVSLTKVSAGEYRTWNRLQHWLSSASSAVGSNFRKEVRPEKAFADKFSEEVNMVWQKTGYTLICGSPENPMKISGDESELKTKSYKLLLLFNEDCGNTFILLNNHLANRDTVYGAWDAALMPALKNLSDFFDRVRADIIRIRDDLMIRSKEESRDTNQSLDELEKALQELSQERDEDLEKELVELESAEFIKFSPTDGEPQRYVYTLCYLPSLALKAGKELEVEGLKMKSRAQALQYLMKVDIASCFRYEPGSEVGTLALPGYIWFPWKNIRGELAWRDNPGINARNRDVMTWVANVLEDLAGANAEPPAYLCLGENRDLPKHEYPFTGFEKNDWSDFESRMRRVPLRYNRNVCPYKDSRFEVVRLRRSEGKNGACIEVWDNSKAELKGILCPSQRYVLKSGIDRARRLREAVKNLTRSEVDIATLGSNGVPMVTLGRGSFELDIIPPIIEPVLGSEGQFLICDGNHRVVEYCWNKKEDLFAILAREVSVPYYIYPMRPEQWPQVAEAPLYQTPDLFGKYTVRVPTKEERKMYVSDDLREQGKDPSNYHGYRMFYRDFEAAGFNLGGQGGRIGKMKNRSRNGG